MKATEFLASPLSWDHFKPSKTLVRNVLLMVAMYTVLTMGSYAVVRAATNSFAFCGADEAMLEFPVYNAKGLVIDTVQSCGKPKKVCTLKTTTARGEIYSCPALLRPR